VTILDGVCDYLGWCMWLSWMVYVTILDGVCDYLGV